LFSSDMVAEGYMFTNGESTKWKTKRLEGGKTTLKLCCYRMYNGYKNETTVRVIRCLHY